MVGCAMFKFLNCPLSRLLLVLNAVCLIVFAGLLSACNETGSGEDKAGANAGINTLVPEESPLIALPSRLIGAQASQEIYHFGRSATAVEIAGWDIDVRPDGLGLPPGEGSVEGGELLYEAKCSGCHGTFGEGEGRWPKLAGGMGTLTHERPDKTVGSYWPYASTLWDYIRRAMPFTAPQSLSVDETYAITAYVLYLNDLVEDDFTLTQKNFTDINMPNQNGFYVDDRPDVANPRCMSACVDPNGMTVVESLRGITPTSHFREGGTDARAYGKDGGHKVESGDVHPGKVVYESACKVCHGAGVAGAPLVGDGSAWVERLQQSKKSIYQHALMGFQGGRGVMPPKGGQPHLADDAVKQAVDYMVEKSR